MEANTRNNNDATFKYTHNLTHSHLDHEKELMREAEIETLREKRSHFAKLQCLSDLAIHCC